MMDEGRWKMDDGGCHTDLTDNSDKLFINVGDFFAKIVWKIKKSDEKHLSVSFSTESSYCGVGRGTAVFL